MYNFVVGTQKNCLSEKVLLGTPNMLWLNTVNSEIFARILFLRIALKHIFSTLKFMTRA